MFVGGFFFYILLLIQLIKCVVVVGIPTFSYFVSRIGSIVILTFRY